MKCRQPSLREILVIILRLINASLWLWPAMARRLVISFQQRILRNCTHQNLCAAQPAVAELTTEDIDKITSARMDPEHDHLNTLLDET